MSDIYSFYQLISKYQIEIPIIQRDYAQGRNNSKAADVRKSLVDNMIKAVKEEKSLFFDFVYGRVDNNKFIPFDGQQRLTTLFLFHKYVFEKCQSDSGCNHKDNCSCRGILGRFSYATRQSSREFCEKLVENNIIPDDKYKKHLRETFIAALKKEDNEKEKKADEFIKSIDNWIYRFVTNQSWFYPGWGKDPTVMGMLTMLDEIHCQMKNETDFKTFAEKLTSGCNCPITFHFVDMGEHKMSDETYVKMNARGKTLTPFENFKASLEQYLEEKSKSENLSAELQEKYSVLLCRLKGEYDEALQKYTGIDGTWLDLFWKVENKNKKEKDLPDTLMMSFFNRHVMNVWRCWYANPKSEKPEKKEEYDTFNTRIQKEMPLYPTKDKFVSFEIYSYVLDKCDVYECLTPIFNIFDALSAHNNTIENDCQAVWNRNGNETKWSIFNGYINNQNRETYPSRIAFYATMKYFQNENYSDTTSLSQWMRVVWNIIENSTIDSSDTYHAALRLIEKLSAKSHTIYNALANEFESFELGNQYHAQEQVAEEVAKAEQILNGELRPTEETREEIIIDAEKYAFFKGAIRFLFQNAEGKVTEDSWKQFDKKWENSKKYFKEIPEQKNVMNKDYDNANLLKALISHFTPQNYWGVLNWHYRIFNNYAKTWRYYLLNDHIFGAIQKLMMGNTSIEVLNPSQDEAENRLYQLSQTKLLDFVIKTIPESWIRNYHGHKAIFPSGKGVFLDADIRDSLLTTDGIKLKEEDKVPGTNFLYGSNIFFQYNQQCFIYYSNNTVCLMNDNWEGKKLKNQENPDTPENNFYFFVDEKETFLHKLDCLIAQAFPDTDKSVCLECKEKICESTLEE